MLWNSVLRSWCEPKITEWRRKDGTLLEFAAPAAARALQLDPSRVRPCLQVLDGRSVQYGVIVDS
jgi:hypothetical protein